MHFRVCWPFHFLALCVHASECLSSRPTPSFTLFTQAPLIYFICTWGGGILCMSSPNSIAAHDLVLPVFCAIQHTLHLCGLTPPQRTSHGSTVCSESHVAPGNLSHVCTSRYLKSESRKAWQSCERAITPFAWRGNQGHTEGPRHAFPLAILLTV